jgi:transcriptional regulator with XRE-family HTH domain
MPVYSSHLLSYSDLRIGLRIREVRQRLGLTLHDFAARSGLSPARLSQIENEEHVLDLRQAFAIAKALGTPLESLLPPERNVPYEITREEEAHSREPREGRIYAGAKGDRPTRNVYWPLAELFVGRQMEPMLGRIMPSDDEELQFSRHHDHEFAFVLKGGIEFAIETTTGRECHELMPGDCVSFRSNLPHRLRSLSAEPAESLHVFSSTSTPLRAPLEWLSSGQTNDENGGGDARIGGELAFLRAAHGWTVKSMAQLVGLSERHLRQIEEGRRGVRLDTMMTFARAFGEPLRHFIRNGPQAEPCYFIQRASDIDRIPGRKRRHPLARPQMGVTFDYLPLARGFPFRYTHPYLLHVPNVGIESLTTHEHHGQELIYMLDGQIELTTYAEDIEVKETLRPGDSCYLDATVPHLVRGQSRNPYSQTSASVLVVFWCPLGESYLFDLPVADNAAAPEDVDSDKQPEPLSARRRR